MFRAAVLLLPVAVFGLAYNPIPSAHHESHTCRGTIIKNIDSHPGLSIEYKETHLCEPIARAWSGYVHMPSTYLEDVMGDSPYNVSIFFWYFEARHSPETAPTAIWLSGGPGVSSMQDVGAGNGPCYVLKDSNDTDINPFSWNERVNMLYLDQPVGTGFSYNSLVNSTYNLLTYAFTGGADSGITPVAGYNGTVPAANATFYNGVLPDQNPEHTVNNTIIAARTIWHFAQAWFGNFPEWATRDKTVSVWGNSYGGYWVPRTAAYFQQQNEQIAEGKLDALVLPVNTIAITNGCIDMLYQMEWYPDQAYNNTYDLQVIDKQRYEGAKHNYTKSNGCRDLISRCRELGELYDPDEIGINATVNEACVAAVLYCGIEGGIMDALDEVSTRSDFDIAHLKPDPFPTSYTYGFFNKDWVIEELGAHLNFTPNALNLNGLFLFTTGDPARRAGMKDIEYLLDTGVKVALAYGDRDYRCPWNGAEALSLQANWTGAADFRTAGYEYIQVNSTYQGGVVRQHGNFSFSRVFQSGHDVSAYQPATAFEIFNRAMFDTDIATGQISTADQYEAYSTVGPASSFHIKEHLPPVPPIECYILNSASCTDEQLEALADGTAAIEEYIVVKPVGGYNTTGSSSTGFGG